MNNNQNKKGPNSVASRASSKKNSHQGIQKQSSSMSA